MSCLAKTTLGIRVATFLSASLIFLAGPAHAKIDLINVESNTASFFKGIGSNKKEGDSATIYGGTAGSVLCAGSGSEVCNNCESNNAITETCNEKQVYSELVLQIRFKSDQKTGVTAIADKDGNIVGGLEIIDSQNLAAGAEHVAKVKWGNICNTLLSIGSTCEGDGSGSLTLGVNGNGDSDLNDTEDDKTNVQIVVQKNIEAQARACDDTALGINDGLCDFSVFPGDEKVFFQDPSVPDGFPTGAANPAHVIIRLYGVVGTDDSAFSEITHSDNLGEFAIEKEDDGDLVTDSNTIEGLENGKEYFFTAATVDEAQNVGYHIPVNRLDTNAQFLTRGIHSATPSPVSGLLTEDAQCFIATAAFGSPFEKHVVTLREFRDRFLKTNFIGRLFVKIYYKTSPPIARIIARHHVLKTLVRGLLIPLTLAASWALNWSWLSSAFLLFAFIAGAAAVFIFRRRGTV